MKTFVLMFLTACGTQTIVEVDCQQTNMAIGAALNDIQLAAPWIVGRSVPTFIKCYPLPPTYVGEDDNNIVENEILIDPWRAADQMVPTLAHEMGHAIGLGHNTKDPNSVMYPAAPPWLDAKQSTDSLLAECVLQHVRCHGLNISILPVAYPTLTAPTGVGVK